MRVIRAADLDRDQQVLDQFKDYLLREDHAPATIRAYLSDLDVFKQWLSWIFEGQPVSLAQVQTAELTAFRKYLIHQKNQRPATVNRRVQSLRTFYGFLARQGLIDEDPARRVRFVRRGMRTRPRTLKRREVLALLRAAAPSPQGMAQRNTAIVQLMLQTGLRVGEVAVLKVEDVLIRERSGRVTVREGKGGKARQVPLNSAARRALTRYLSTLDAKERAPSRALFKSKRGGAITVRGLQKMVLTLLRRAGLEDQGISAHTFRHTFATSYLKSNPGKLVELAALLGHESLDTTAIYTHPSEEDLSEDLERSALNLFEDV